MLLCVYVHFILKCLLKYCMLFLLYCHKTMFTSISVCAHVACVQLTGRFILSFWPLCVGLYLHRSNFDIYLHSYSLCHLLLYCTYHSLHDCAWQQWSGMLNCVSKLCYTYIPVLFLLFTNILLLHTERVCIIGTVLLWKNINSISNDCHLHYLFTCLTHYEMYAHKYIVLLSLKMKKQMQNRFTQVHNIIQIHICTRPPSYHRAKPSACPMFLLRMFWTSTVRWIPQLCEFVCLCVLFVPWWVGG